jgi:DNA/RNA-binding domain of Phe-tRNA-synthetase-like protein
MHFQHAKDLRDDFPALVAGVVAATGISPDVDTRARVAHYATVAAARLSDIGSVAEFPEIRAWRRAFSRMGLKPTQYRCASEALLRRFAKEGSLPRIHPLVDLCNAVSLAWAIPVAAIDTARISGDLEVRYAAGNEIYRTFDGEVEYPQPGEVSFVDGAGRAHARRWTNRQSGYSAVRDTTASVLIVAEALHVSAAADVAALTATVAAEVAALWSVTPATAVLYGNDKVDAFEGPG